MAKQKKGIQSRVGRLFHQSIELIKDKRLLKGTSKERVSTGKLTNMITKHKLWKEIIKDTIDSSQEEVDKFGK